MSGELQRRRRAHPGTPPALSLSIMNSDHIKHNLRFRWIETVPVQCVGSVLDWQWRVEPVGALLQDNATGEWLLSGSVGFDIFQQGVMLVGGENIAASTFRIEKIDVSVLHADNEVDVKKSLFAALPFMVFNGVVGFAAIAVLIPPVNQLLVCFKEIDIFLFVIGGGVLMNDRQWIVVLSRVHAVGMRIMYSLFGQLSV